MEPLYVAIVAAIVLNLLLLIGLLLFLPRLFRRQDVRTSEEATRLREMLLDVLSEQEAVTLRQAQIGSSLASMQTQIGQISENPATATLSPEVLAEAAGFPQLDRRIEALQGQIGVYFEQSGQAQRDQRIQDSQSWTHLLGLLATMQDRIAVLNTAVEQQQPQMNLAANQLLAELDGEMQNLRTLADEIASLQWKLRRSVLERETSLAALRAQVLGAPKFGHRAA